MDGEQPKFSQIYIYDSDPQHQAQLRMDHQNDTLERNTVLQLQDMMQFHNPYAAIYRTAKERLDVNEHISLCLKTVDAPNLDQRRYNHPTASEVAVIMVGTGDDGATERDLLIQAKDGGLRSISYLKSFYIPLRYPMLFPYGEQGWHPNIRIQIG
jgi:hypothetical protein